MSWGQVMTQKRATQVISSLSSVYNSNIDTVRQRKLWVKKYYDYTNLFLVSVFVPKLC